MKLQSSEQSTIVHMDDNMKLQFKRVSSEK